MAKHPTVQGGKRPQIHFPKNEKDFHRAYQLSNKSGHRYSLNAVVKTPLGFFDVLAEGSTSTIVMVSGTSLRPEHYGLEITGCVLRAVNEKETREWGDTVRKFISDETN